MVFAILLIQGFRGEQRNRDRRFEREWPAHEEDADFTKLGRIRRRSYDRQQFWPVHVHDEAGGVLKGLWFGAAGVVWALHYLSQCGGAVGQVDCADAIARVHAKFLAEEDP